MIRSMISTPIAPHLPQRAPPQLHPAPRTTPRATHPGKPGPRRHWYPVDEVAMASRTAAPRSPVDPKDPKPTTFAQVLRDEFDRVQGSRQKRGVAAAASPDNLTGLAFSGGGIRSATFNLGILQALAERGLLRKFDYVSTVSGRGYIGSWLAALTRRLSKEISFSFDQVEKALSPRRYDHEHRSEPPVLHWLRLYSNYLTPRK